MAVVSFIAVLGWAGVAAGAVPKRVFRVCIEQVGSVETIGDLNVKRGKCRRR
jgi:hypothetical protein